MTQRAIQVCAHWQDLPEPVFMGTLYASSSRGKEIFSFEYDAAWLQQADALVLDPNLGLFAGPQYARDDHANFGLFLDSSPDRWGRVLMRRREAQLARQERRPVRSLSESDYLLGVYDGHRMGGLRFRLSEDGPFLDDNADLASPPWARLRELEYASLQLERDDAEQDKDYSSWLKMLIAPGGSLGGARPKASVIDDDGHPWIAKFPSRSDTDNIGAWEYLVYQLAIEAGVETAESMMKRFSGPYDTFMTKRFDRKGRGGRIHFASAMTLLSRKDGDSGEEGVSYLDIADFIIRYGAQTSNDLEQLWRRIVFNVCVSNTDDHLRNHGFLLDASGWRLSPAFDMNPSAAGDGLTLNISQNDNTQDLELVRSVAPDFRVKAARAAEIISDVLNVVRRWAAYAKDMRLVAREVDEMRHAFRVADRQ